VKITENNFTNSAISRLHGTQYNTYTQYMNKNVLTVHTVIHTTFNRF